MKTPANRLLFPDLEGYIAELGNPTLSAARAENFQILAEYARKKIAQGNPLKLNFICTHNSRRSQLAQFWAAALAHSNGIECETSSGGTEVTAFHPHAVEALRHAGFEIQRGTGENPAYEIRFSPTAPPQYGFSKLFNHPVNPSTAFAAIMTCSEADAGCPYVPGAELRIPLPYTDPKSFEGTGNEPEAYQNTSRIIARELNYFFQLLHP